MRSILTYFLLLQLFRLNAQAPYHPMLVEGRSWDVFQVPAEHPICHYESAGNYSLHGDSLLGGLIYKKLVYHIIRSNPEFPFCGGFYRDTGVSYFSALLREDTLARKVYRWNPDNNPGDEVLYDFSLQAGDTLHYPFQSYPILSVTDWVLANGEQRKAFEIGGWPLNYYVEGVGYLMGQFGPVYYPFEGWSEITCMRDGDEQVFTNAVDGGLGCILATSPVQNIENQFFRISPNPFSDHLIWNMPEWQTGASFVVSLFDLAGREVFRKAIKQESGRSSVDLPPLPPGVYAWAVNGVLQGKVVKI